MKKIKNIGIEVIKNPEWKTQKRATNTKSVSNRIYIVYHKFLKKSIITVNL